MSRTKQSTTLYLCNTCGTGVEMTNHDSWQLKKLEPLIKLRTGLPLVIVCYSCAYKD